MRRILLRKSLISCVSLLVVLAANVAVAIEFENSSVVGHVPDRVLVVVKEGVTLVPSKAAGIATVGVPNLDALSEQYAVSDFAPLYAGLTAKLDKSSVLGELERTYAVDFDAAKGLDNALAAYAALPEVERVSPVDICKMFDAFLPNDPAIENSQWYLRNVSLGGKDIRAIGGWNNAPDLGDSNVVVAIMDSGVHWRHPDLGGPGPDHAQGAIWMNWPEYYGQPNVDDDSNGKIDDMRGWDWVHNPGGGTIPEEDTSIADNDPSDFGGHGTNCAGTTAAITNNGIGIAGTAPGCKIMALRIGWYSTDAESGVVRMDWAAQAMLYGIANGAKIFNCSWGSSSWLGTAVTQVQNQGGLIISAAGNDDSDDFSGTWLGTRQGVISVAATNESDGKASFSNYGWWVEISAPGVGIYTTSVNGYTQESTYTTTQGTSFSSPITAGAAALLWSVFPDYDATQISNLLYDSADNIDDQNPFYVGELGAGRVNLLKALGDDFHAYPAEFPTFLDAINEAGTGETVATEGGIVLQNETILGNDLQVLGGWDASFTSRDPLGNPTIFNGDAQTPALQFAGDVTPATVVDGYRCQNGGGKYFSSIPFSGRFGGGVTLNNVSPTLRNIEVMDNVVGYSNEFGGGGGILLSNSDAVLENVLVHDNTAVHGAGIYIYGGQPIFTDCTIENNTPLFENLAYQPDGGGIYAVDTDLSLTDCNIRFHEELNAGGGIYMGVDSGSPALTMVGGEIAGNTANANGAGIYLDSGVLSLTDVELIGNTKLPASPFMNGGGIYVTGADVYLDGVVVEGSDASIGGGASLNNCGEVSVLNSVFASNVASFFGGGLYVSTATTATVTGNTFVTNDGSVASGSGLYISGGTPEVSNNISAFNTGDGMFFGGATPVLSCNDVYDNGGANYGGIADPTGSDGNISEDPLFCNMATGDYHIQNASPCAPDNSAGCGLIGALSAGCGEVGVGEEDGGVPLVFRVEQNYPNPFNPLTTIRFSLPQAGRTTVTVFDLAGRQVRQLVAADLPAAEHEVQWNGENERGHRVATGVYFYQVISGGNAFTGRMALVK